MKEADTSSKAIKRVQAGLGKLLPGGVELTSTMNWQSREALPCHSVLHLKSAQCAALVSVLLRSFNSSSAAGTKGCLDLSCRHKTEIEACHEVSDQALAHGKPKTVQLVCGEAQTVGFLLGRTGCPLV